MTFPLEGRFNNSASLVLAFSGIEVTIGRDRGNFSQNYLSRGTAQAGHVQVFHLAKTSGPKHLCRHAFRTQEYREGAGNRAGLYALRFAFRSC